MATKSEELKKQIAGFDKIINDPNTSPALKSAMEKAKVRATEALRAEGVDTDERLGNSGLPGVGVNSPAMMEERKKLHAKEKAEGKAKEKKPKAEKKVKAKEEEEEDLITITVKGVSKTLNINDCKQAIEAAHLRKARDKESGKKTKSKSKGEKAKDRIVLAAEGLTELIPVGVDAKTQVKALKQLEKDSSAAMEKYCHTIGVSKALTEKLSNAYATVIEPILDEIEAELEAAKKK